jgi:hypothetical protein
MALAELHSLLLILNLAEVAPFFPPAFLVQRDLNWQSPIALELLSVTELALVAHKDVLTVSVLGGVMVRQPGQQNNRNWSTRLCHTPPNDN